MTEDAEKSGGGAVAAVEACLREIVRRDGDLRAFITVTAELALDAARNADAAWLRGEPAGALHGRSIAIKDCIDVAGVRCTAGSSFFSGRVATTDATVARRLRDAGGAIIGKTNLHEFAFGGTTQNAFHGVCRNPWDRGRVPGGSSGGSAVAVATGMAWGALGTDTGSSIRMPAALTGTTGFRPTGGTVPADGTLPVSPPHDVIGPIARSAADAALLHAVVTGKADVLTNLDRPLAGTTIALPDDFFLAEADSGVAVLVVAAARQLEAMGATIVTRAISGAPDTQSWLQPIVVADAADFHRDRLAHNPDGFSVGVRTRMLPGLDMRAVDYARCLRQIEAWRERCDAFFANDADAMITPTVPIVAPRIAADDVLAATTSRISRFCWAWPAAGVPAITVPCGFLKGMPVGLQIAAGRGRDDLVLAIAHRFQGATTWHKARPPDVAG